MRTRLFLACSLGLLSLGPPSFAQQAKEVPRIGFLGTNTAAALSARTEAFRQGLRERGYVEGKTIIVEYRYAEGKLDRMRELVADLVRLNVRVIVSAGGEATRTAKEATSTIPIVMTQDQDPVAAGFVVSLARPGGNITGLSNQSPEIVGKQLQILKEIVPGLSRVAVLGVPNQPGTAESLKGLQATAKALKVQTKVLDVRRSEDIGAAFREARKARADALLLTPGPLFLSHATEIGDLAIKGRLPSVHYASEHVETGGLLSYSVSFTDLSRRAATYVDKILKGARPADLPVEQPTKFELVINMKTAKALGLTIPQSILVRADRVIE